MIASYRRWAGRASPNPEVSCISRSVRDQVRDRIALSFVDVGEQQLKNIERPVRCFRLAFDGFAALRDSLTSSATNANGHRLSIVVLPFINLSADSEQDISRMD